LKEFFDACEADGDVLAHHVIYVGIGADERCLPQRVHHPCRNQTARRPFTASSRHDLARNVADRLDVRTDDAQDVAAQMHAAGDAVTVDSLAEVVQRLHFEVEED